MKLSLSAFPDGVAGLALVLLRASVIASLVEAKFLVALPLFVSTLFVSALAAMIGAGLFTRSAAALAAMGFSILTIAAGSADPTMVMPHALAAAALALIGPGAYSLDAQRFGRQTYHLPR